MEAINNNLLNKIKDLKEKRGALILAHFYQPLAVQLAADYVGDSFELAKKAAATEKQIIVFCGVSFMGESAKLLAPDKTVIMPEPNAGCKMADMVTPEKVLQMRKLHPNAAVVCYVNSNAATKAVSDICCTSANAERVVASLDADEIIFVPDKNLGSFIAAKMPDKKFYFIEGHCPIHSEVSLEAALEAKKRYPNAPMLIHPECSAKLLEVSDFIGSTSQIINYTVESSLKEFIICTEKGVSERLSYFYPDKKFYSLEPELICSDMKMTTPELLLESLEELKHEIKVEQKYFNDAAKTLEKMIKIK